MTSPYEPADRAAFEKLEPSLRKLLEELSAWRKRAQRAETAADEMKGSGGATGPAVLELRQRIVDLEKDNQKLRRRVGNAREQLEALRSRLVFLEARDGAA